MSNPESDFNKVRLLGNTSRINIRENNFTVTYNNPWALQAIREDTTSFNIEPLIRLSIVPSFRIKTEADYHYMRVYKMINEGKVEKKSPITHQEAETLKELIEKIKLGEVEVLDGYEKPPPSPYIDRVVDFLLPRICLVPSSYVPGRDIALAKIIENKLRYSQQNTRST